MVIKIELFGFHGWKGEGAASLRFLPSTRDKISINKIEKKSRHGLLLNAFE